MAAIPKPIDYYCIVLTGLPPHVTDICVLRQNWFTFEKMFTSSDQDLGVYVEKIDLTLKFLSTLFSTLKL